MHGADIYSRLSMKLVKPKAIGKNRSVNFYLRWTEIIDYKSIISDRIAGSAPTKVANIFNGSSFKYIYVFKIISSYCASRKLWSDKNQRRRKYDAR